MEYSIERGLRTALACFLLICSSALSTPAAETAVAPDVTLEKLKSIEESLTFVEKNLAKDLSD
jgi:hypothetical protein